MVHWTGNQAPALYLLIHPERFLSNDSSTWATDRSAEKALLKTDFEQLYGETVRLKLTDAQESAVILDPMDVEALCDDTDLDHNNVTADDLQDAAKVDHSLEAADGIPLYLFDKIIIAAPHELEEATKALLPPSIGAKVLIGGFSRYSCIRKVQAVLREQGWLTEVDETTALPLEDAGVAYYLSLSGNKLS